jgi:HlyD family secretion protein
VGEAAVLQAKASLAQAETSLWRAKRSLGYCTITSPVSGVIIDRRVNIGQTVNASMDAPSLFLIAKDLRRMQVWVAVNEADVARVYAGQPVAFTVDALPDASFRGTVSKVRLNASMTQNVVTYTVEITTDNADGRLLPYLTANVRFEVQRRSQVLRVPTAALRWTPSVEQVVPAVRAAAAAPDDTVGEAKGSRRKIAPAAPAPGTESSAVKAQPADAVATAKQDTKPGFLWVVENSYVRPIPVRTGLANGTVTEVESPELAEGLQVVTGLDTTARASSGTKNPFTPNLPRPPKGGPPPG